MFRKTTLIVVTTLLTIGLNITNAEAGKRSGGGGSGGFSRGGSSKGSGGMKSSFNVGNASQFRSSKPNFSGGLSRQNLAQQFQSKGLTSANTNFKPSNLAAIKATTQPQLKQFQQKLTQHVANNVLQHTGTFKCGPIKVCPKPSYNHCHKPWLSHWIQPCLKPVVITCPTVQPVLVPVPVPTPVPVAADPVEPEAPRPEVVAGAQIALDGEGFGNDAGQIRLNIAGLALVAPVLEWNENGVTLAIPPMELARPADAELIILHASGATLQTIEVTIVPAAS